MGTDVEPTQEQIDTARRAILTQLSASDIANNYSSVAEALEDLGMWEFIENQAMVVASLQAFSIRDNAIIHRLTMAGAYAVEVMEQEDGWNLDE